MAGPKSAIFDPKEIFVDSKKSCEELTFELKGFGLEIPVRWQDEHGQVSSSGPQGIPIRISNDEAEEAMAYTDASGIAVFDEISLSGNKLQAWFEVPKIVGNDLYQVQVSPLNCELKEREGFHCSNGHQFVIEASLLTGAVK